MSGFGRATLVLLAMASNGCNLVLGTEEGVLTGGAGQGGADGAGPAGGNGGRSGDGGHGAMTASGGGGEGGGTVECSGTGQGTCPDPPECRTTECVGGQCTTTNDEPLVGCSGGVCDGSGACVECVDDDQCTISGEFCDLDTGTCIGAQCDDDTQNGQETDTDCGGPACAPCANTAQCAVAEDCVSGFCDGTTCEACVGSGDCESSQFCDASLNGGTCVVDKPAGQACGDPAECDSGSCVDAICCEAACTDPCHGCATAVTGLANGTCGFVLAGQDPHADCPAAQCRTGSCGSGGVCENAPAGSSCSDGTFCNGADSCNAAGVCSIHAGDPCLPLSTTDADCSGSCNEATDSCTANDPNGTSCNDGLFCNGFDSCSAGVCSIHAGNPCPGNNVGPSCDDSCSEGTDACNGPDAAGTVCNEDGDGTAGACTGSAGANNCTGD